MAEQDQDKTEEATPQKLEQAREKGEVARSADLSGTLVLLAFAITAIASLGWVGKSLLEAFRQMLGLVGAGTALGGGTAAELGALCAPVLRTLVPALMVVLLVAVVANLWQVGFVFSTEPLKLKFERLNPAQAFKKIFSKRTLWEVGKTLVKLLVLAIVLVWYVRKQWLDASPTIVQTLPELAAWWLRTFTWASMLTLGLLLLAALADLAFVQREFQQKMRMSRRELRDDVKRREGDPEVRAKRKQLLRDLLKQTKALGKVREADILLTNPTHYAVALQYRPATMRAPIVLAKGAGTMAGLIRRLARRHAIPIEADPATTRLLFRRCEIGGPIPEELFPQIAALYRRRQLLRLPGTDRR